LTAKVIPGNAHQHAAINTTGPAQAEGQVAGADKQALV
jgi:hypothetical protein